jgi:pyruvate/2-oxoglutarate dehydrogenase complex dihydrolipoamide dehydrogenase (E3) component
MSQRKTIAILGGGSAGFTAARTAARLGARVLLFLGDNADRASLCVNRGCMPSKAMFHPIDTLHHARKQGLLRAEPILPEAYLGQIVAWKDREIARFRAYRQRAISAHHDEDFQVIRANARFTDAHTLESGGTRHRVDAVILATGSLPSAPPVPGLAELAGDVWDSDELLTNTKLPESLVMIGAGAIGLEFALRYARLGCRVTVIARSRPLSPYPEEFGLRMAAIYEREGIRMMLGTATRSVRRDIEGWFVVETEGDSGFEPVIGQRLALAVGRQPALASMGLDAAGIELDARGRLPVGDDMRVIGHPHVFAAGDVLGRRMVVHQAHIEAGIAADNAVNEGDTVWNRRADIQVVYSDPEFAYTGLTPGKAAEAGHGILTGRKESRLVGKLHLAGDDHGLGAFIADRDTHQLLGGGLLCDGAADLIHLPAYMVDHEHTVHQGATAEYYHPARIEIVSSILDDLCSQLGGVPPRRADVKSG